MRRQSGAVDYDMHALRYTVTAALAAAGCCSGELIQTVTRHKPSAMVARYAFEACLRARAAEAQNRRKQGRAKPDGRCCRTLTVGDSHRESTRLYGVHEQAITRPLPHHELVQLYCGASQAGVSTHA